MSSATQDDGSSANHQVFMAEWFNDATYADLTITCGYRQFKVHRIVLASRCDFFQKCCSGGFREQETRIINMDDDEPDALENMLRYLYTTSLDHMEYLKDISAFDTYDHQLAELFVLADKYSLPRLSELFIDIFNSRTLQQTAGSRLKAYIRIASLPSTVHGKRTLLKQLRIGLTAPDMAWESLCPKLHIEQAKQANGRYAEFTYSEEVAELNADIVDIVGQNPEAATELIIHLGLELALAKELIAKELDQPTRTRQPTRARAESSKAASEDETDEELRSRSNEFINPRDGSEESDAD